MLLAKILNKRIALFVILFIYSFPLIITRVTRVVDLVKIKYWAWRPNDVTYITVVSRDKLHPALSQMVWLHTFGHNFVTRTQLLYA